jgi:hypothetical protein
VTATLDKHVHVEHVMGTAVTFDVRGEQPEHEAVAAAVHGCTTSTPSPAPTGPRAP